MFVQRAAEVAAEGGASGLPSAQTAAGGACADPTQAPTTRDHGTSSEGLYIVHSLATGVL
ncbi:hypothetical protein EON66_12085 [archaeon]|nr:MAG: hypothetical protein EON66_12085 [archaeon]